MVRRLFCISRDTNKQNAPITVKCGRERKCNIYTPAFRSWGLHIVLKPPKFGKLGFARSSHSKYIRFPFPNFRHITYTITQKLKNDICSEKLHAQSSAQFTKHLLHKGHSFIYSGTHGRAFFGQNFTTSPPITCYQTCFTVFLEHPSRVTLFMSAPYLDIPFFRIFATSAKPPCFLCLEWLCAQIPKDPKFRDFVSMLLYLIRI